MERFLTSLISYMDGVGVSQISSGTGLLKITVLEASVGIRKELALSA
jgi:hypothetical protein